MLGRDNPGIPHIRNIYLKFEKNFQPPKQNADDSSDEESTPVVEEEESLAIRQAQFTVRLLLDFLPPNILEVFRYERFRCKKRSSSLSLLAVFGVRKMKRL